MSEYFSQEAHFLGLILFIVEGAIILFGLWMTFFDKQKN